MPSAAATTEPQRRRPLTLPERDDLFGRAHPWLDRDSEAVAHLAALDIAGEHATQLVGRR